MTLQSTPILVAERGCLTGFGDAGQTHAALLGAQSALRLEPVLGDQGGDRVPLALAGGRALTEAVPPGWLAALLEMAAPVRGQGWGTARRPICFSSSNFGVGSLIRFASVGSVDALAYSTPERCVNWIRTHLGWGPHFAIFSHACVSAHIALLHASRLLESKAADEVLVFSFDFLSPFVAGGFHSLKILNGRMPTPYQESETGSIGLGDGAAFAVVTRNRGDLRILRQNVHNEMYHFTANQPDGGGFDSLLAGLSKGAPHVWFKGHGTGTIESGRLECLAAARALPLAPIVGWKGSLGHTLGSCGLVELVLAAEAIASGRTPGTVGSSAPVFVPAVSLEAFDNRAFDGALCASNAFGGAHAGLILTHA